MHEQDDGTRPKNQMSPEGRQGSERQRSERADIARRVANFKAHQAALRREREEYYLSVRARIDRALEMPQPTNVIRRPE
jgi:hypothetical protein